jgi:hypothetical protein
MKNQNYVVPTGDMAREFHGMIRLNETGVCYWKELEQGITREELVGKMLEWFPALDRQTAESDLDEFLGVVGFALE